MAETRIGIEMNLARAAPTQMLDYNFNSMCWFNQKWIGANEDGLHALDVRDAAGVDVPDALFELPMSDFGIQGRKRLMFVWVYYEAAGDLLLTITPDDGASFTCPLPARLGGNRQTMARRVPVDRTCSGYYFSIRIENVAGCDFSIDRIEVAVADRVGK